MMSPSGRRERAGSGGQEDREFKAEELYLTILNTIPDGLTQIEHGRITFVSDRASEIFGYPPEILLQMNELELAAPEERERIKAILDEVESTGQPLGELEFWIVRGDGARRYIRNRFTRLSVAEGIQKHLVLTTDITERKAAEDALVESEERYRVLFDEVPVGLYRTTPGGQILDANPALVEMLGYPDRQTLLRINAANVFAVPADRRKEMDLLDRAGGKLEYAELKLRRFDGEVIWVRDTVRSIRHNLNNTIIYYDGSLEDITERKAAEQARSLLASIVESSIDAIIGMDLDGAIVSWNSGAERIYGYRAADVIGRTVAILAPAALPDELPKMLQEIRQGRRVEQHETVRICKGGQEIHVALTLSPIKDIDGRIIGVSKIARDITLQKRMEQYILRAERLAAMGQISASLAHEVKNPLQAIQSNLELLRDFPLEPDERDESLRICSQEVERLLDIIQRMLSFARTERQTVHPVSIQQIWEQALALLGKSLQKAEVNIDAEFAADLPPVLVVADQIGQVLLNLVLNAIEIMPQGGVLRVRARREGQLLVLTLQNNGPPIPPAHLDHIFDPFFTTKPEGTGLGLFISHNIVQQHGGTLGAENLKNGQGVVFSLTLPVLQAEDGAPPGIEAGGK